MSCVGRGRQGEWRDHGRAMPMPRPRDAFSEGDVPPCHPAASHGSFVPWAEDRGSGSRPPPGGADGPARGADRGEVLDHGACPPGQLRAGPFWRFDSSLGSVARRGTPDVRKPGGGCSDSKDALALERSGGSRGADVAGSRRPLPIRAVSGARSARSVTRLPARSAAPRARGSNAPIDDDRGLIRPVRGRDLARAACRGP